MRAELLGTRLRARCMTVLLRGGCAALFLLPATVGAQDSRLWIDVGPTTVRYADSINVNALTISPGLQLFGRRGYVFATGSLAQMSGASTQSGEAGAGVSTDTWRRMSAEVGGTAGGSAHSDDSRTGQLLGVARLYANGGGIGAWLEGGAGSTWDGGRWRDLRQAGIGGWADMQLGNAMASVTHIVVDDTIRYSDVTLRLRRQRDRLELTGTVGARIGDPVPSLITDRAWGSASATFWMHARLGIVASAGTYPIDFSQGYPGGRFASLAIRISERHSGAPMDRFDVMSSSSTSTARALEVRRVRGGSHRLRVLAPGVSSVEVMGSFSDWTPVALAPESGGWWGVTLALGRRSHEINIRVNGGPWSVPPGLTPLRDEFGGASGLLVIP